MFDETSYVPSSTEKFFLLQPMKSDKLLIYEKKYDGRHYEVSKKFS